MASPLTATLTMFSIQVGFPLAGILTGERMFGRTKRTRKFRYYLGVTAFAFGGWYLSNYFTTKYLENVDITLNAEPDWLKEGKIHGESSCMICDKVAPEGEMLYGRTIIDTGVHPLIWTSLICKSCAGEKDEA